jgi:hypothetical protein
MERKAGGNQDQQLGDTDPGMQSDGDESLSPLRRSFRVLYAAPSSNQLQHQNDDRYYQENMNQIADRLARKPKTQRP